MPLRQGINVIFFPPSGIVVPMIQLVAFLGNPGREYEKTRHNAAWLLLDYLAPSAAWQEKFKGRFTSYTPALTGTPEAQSPGAGTGSETGTGGGRVILLKPQTFMNRSGESVGPCAAFFKIPPAGLLAVHDEVELPFGSLDFRRGGGLGGHKGLRSLAAILGTPDFYRLRLGVGRPAHGKVASHVLSRFSREEEIFLDDYLKKAVSILEDILRLPPEENLRPYSRIRLIDGL